MRIFLSSFVILAVAGCATPDPDQSFDDVRALSGPATDDLLWRRDSAADSDIADRVRARLDNPLDVRGVVDVALLNNPALQARFEEIGIAQAAVIDAGRPSNPILGGAVKFPTGGGAADLDFGLTTSLFDILLIPARTRAAKAALESRKYSVADAVRELAHEARRAAITYDGAEAAHGRAAEGRAVADAALGYARAIHEAGNMTALELSDHAAASAEALLAFEQAALDRDLARARLNRVMGLPASADWDWAPADNTNPPPSLRRDEEALRELVTLAGDRRLDLAAHRHRIEELAEARGLAVTWRGLDQGEIGVEAERGGDGWALGPSFAVSLPVFHRGEAGIMRADATLRHARREYETALISVTDDVSHAVARLVRAASAARHYGDHLVPLYGQAVDLALRNYNYMIEGTFELLRRKAREVDARRSWHEARTAYHLALADLERAVGGRVPDDLFISTESGTDFETTPDQAPGADQHDHQNHEDHH